jgi:hypothetical protein
MHSRIFIVVLEGTAFITILIAVESSDLLKSNFMCEKLLSGKNIDKYIIKS